MICEKTKRECDYYFENIGCVANVKCNLQEMKNIPKHGDLIDRQALLVAISKEITDRDRMIGTFDNIEQNIEDAPVVVEATE